MPFWQSLVSQGSLCLALWLIYPATSDITATSDLGRLSPAHCSPWPSVPVMFAVAILDVSSNAALAEG